MPDTYTEFIESIEEFVDLGCELGKVPDSQKVTPEYKMKLHSLLALNFKIEMMILEDNDCTEETFERLFAQFKHWNEEYYQEG